MYRCASKYETAPTRCHTKRFNEKAGQVFLGWTFWTNLDWNQWPSGKVVLMSQVLRHFGSTRHGRPLAPVVLWRRLVFLSFKWLQAVKTQGGIAIPFLECGSDIVMMMIHCDVQPTESILSVSETSSNMYQCTTMMYYTQAGSVTVCCSIGLAILPSILPSSPSWHCQSQRPCITKSINSSNSTLPFPLTSAWQKSFLGTEEVPGQTEGPILACPTTPWLWDIMSAYAHLCSHLFTCPRMTSKEVERQQVGSRQTNKQRSNQQSKYPIK